MSETTGDGEIERLHAALRAARSDGGGGDVVALRNALIRAYAAQAHARRDAALLSALWQRVFYPEFERVRRTTQRARRVRFALQAARFWAAEVRRAPTPALAHRALLAAGDALRYAAHSSDAARCYAAAALVAPLDG